jgi:hypothetical protein
LDCSDPRIDEACDEVTRFSTADAADGCVNLVVSSAPIEKLCQLMIAFALFVSTLTAEVPSPEIDATPLTGVGPVGFERASSHGIAPIARAMIRSARCSRRIVDLLDRRPRSMS